MSSELVTILDPSDIDKYVVADKFNEIINQDPPKSVVEKHPLAKNVLYIPIDKVETLLTKIFTDWYVEILREGQIMNSVYTTVRLYYFHPVHKEWRHQDGEGAVAVQTSKGSTAADMSAIVSDGVMKALPASKSFAIKDAAEEIGRIFGRDLNRKDTFAFTGEYKKTSEEKKEELRKKAKALEVKNESN